MWGKEKTRDEEVVASPVTAATRQPAAASKPIETTIGPNTHFKGDIQGDGSLRVEGVVEGTISTTGNLVITESAKVLAEVKAANVSVAGAVKGNIHANRVEVLATGRVWGDLTVKVMLTNEGAYVSGQIIMPKDVKPPQLEPEPAKPAVPAPAPAAK
ncbi:MAG: polymer-forming cytoskeletal protein [Anaerolineae bacterium]|jgi:cytoskeletal protein CcmA (bactofilin family)|nr:polymer-forming cytoskeletal protein [Anaerolineae bacterium]